MQSSNSLNELENFLNSHDIPKAKKWKKTFLDIARQPHYENVISNIYAFYFKQWEQHGFKNLFEISLKELIAAKTENNRLHSHFTKDLSGFRKLKPVTEEPVSFVHENGKTTQKRIDILLDNGTHVIIIENKIYHVLNNPLHVYWNHLDYPDANKRGVLLSLNETFTNDVNFINITHLELLTQVMNNLADYITEVSDKYLIFLKDFYQNILNLSRNIMTKDEVNFYFNNQLKINQAASFKRNLEKHVIKEIEIAGENTTGITLNIPAKKELSSRLRYYDSIVNPNIKISVLFHDLLEPEQAFSLVVELKGNLANLEHRELFKHCAEIKDGQIDIAAMFNKEKTSWVHFYKKDYHARDFNDVTLHQFIQDRLEKDHLLEVLHNLEAVAIENKL